MTAPIITPALVERERSVEPHECEPKPFGDDLPKGTYALVDTQQKLARALSALRRLWDGTDRGELKALLVETWGPSPASAAEREQAKSMAAQQDKDRLEAGPAPACAGPDCPCHEHDIP